MTSYVEGTPPPMPLPIIWCDFNACGLSSEEEDNCYYSLHKTEFYNLPPEEGLVLFIWDDSDEDEIIGYVATLEKYPLYHTEWRARPDETTWYRGPKFW